MKRKLVRLLALGLTAGMIFSLAACSSSDTSSDTSAADETEEDADDSEDTDSDDTDSEDEDSEDTDSEEEETEEVEQVVMTLTDGTEIELTELEEGYVSIYGEYYCQNDGSYWVFADTILSVSYIDDDSAAKGYICELTFYSTEEDEDGNVYLTAVCTNPLTETSTCWYVTNLYDENAEEVIGIAFVNPSDMDEYIALVLQEDEDEEEDSEDTDSEDTDSEDTDSEDETEEE